MRRPYFQIIVAIFGLLTLHLNFAHGSEAVCNVDESPNHCRKRLGLSPKAAVSYGSGPAYRGSTGAITGATKQTAIAGSNQDFIFACVSGMMASYQYFGEDPNFIYTKQVHELFLGKCVESYRAVPMFRQMADSSVSRAKHIYKGCEAGMVIAEGVKGSDISADDVPGVRTNCINFEKNLSAKVENYGHGQ